MLGLGFGSDLERFGYLFDPFRSDLERFGATNLGFDQHSKKPPTAISSSETAKQNFLIAHLTLTSWWFRRVSTTWNFYVKRHLQPWSCRSPRHEDWRDGRPDEGIHFFFTGKWRRDFYFKMMRTGKGIWFQIWPLWVAIPYICSMGLEYLPTFGLDLWKFHVGKYSSPMEHLGMLNFWG